MIRLSSWVTSVLLFLFTLNFAQAELPEPDFIFPDPHYSFAAAISIPQPIALGAEVAWPSLPKLVGFFEAGYFRYPLSSTASRSGSVMSILVGTRYHPFSNWFYVTGELGYRRLGLTVDISSLKSSDTGQSLASTAQLSLSSLVLGVLVGGEFHMTERFSFAFDLGVQLGLLHSGSVKINPAANDDGSTDLSVDGERALDRLSGLPLPQIALVRLIFKL